MPTCPHHRSSPPWPTRSVSARRRSDRTGMNRLRLIGLRSTMPVLWLLVSGCSSVEKDSPETPAAATTAQVFSTNAVPVEIEDDHVLVRAALNGHAVRLVLDTGASHVLVSPEAAAAAGIQKTEKIKLDAFGDG